MNIIKRAFSFHWFDLVGLFIGLILIATVSDLDALLNVIMSYYLYLCLFVIVFIFYLWLWLLMDHGERAYLRGVMGSAIASYIRIVLATVCLIGIYMLNGSLS